MPALKLSLLHDNAQFPDLAVGAREAKCKKSVALRAA